jgi:hypothetical protein
MSKHVPVNTGQVQIGAYVMQFVGNELFIAQASEPEQALVRLQEEDALQLAEWLGISRPRLLQAVMRDGLETFKAQIRAEYHLPEPEEPEERVIYVSHSSCDETLIALARAADVALACPLCLQRLCPECYYCHNPRCRNCCRYYCPLESRL